MAIVVTNRGLFNLGKFDASAMDVRQAVYVGTRAATDATVRDWNTLSDVVGDAGPTEAAATNYTASTSGGQDLAGVTYTEQDGTDVAEWRATAYTINSVGAGETWTCVANYRWVDSTNANDEVISLDTPASPVVTNGGNITLPQFAVDIVQQ